MAAPPLPGGLEFVVYQLEAEQRMFGYAYVPANDEHNRIATRKLAEFLYSRGVADVRDLAQHRGSAPFSYNDRVCFDSGDAGFCSEITRTVDCPARWFYNRRTNAPLSQFGQELFCCAPGTFNQGDAIVSIDCGGAPLVGTLPPENEPTRFANIELPDRWWADMFVVFVGPERIAVFVAQVTRDPSLWQTLRSAILFWFGAVSLVVPGLNAAIAAAVFGAELAAAYPVLVSLATNTAFNAVLGGQDIEHAVGRALAGYAGASLGGFAGGTFDSNLAAKLTAAATTAVLTKADVGQAVAGALLQAGASGTLFTGSPAIVAPIAAPAQPAEGSMFTDELTDDALPAGGYVDYASDGFEGIDFGALELGGDPNFDPGAGFDPGGTFVDFGTTTGAFDPTGLDIGTPVDDSPLVTGNDGGDWSWDDALSKVTQLALTALQLNKVYQATRRPDVRAAPPSQVVNKNGTITTRNPDGTVTTARPVAGQPVAAADGSLILNNGDGTYTVISPLGQSTTARYPVPGAPLTAGGGGLFAGLEPRTMLLLGAAGLGAVLLLRGRR